MKHAVAVSLLLVVLPLLAQTPPGVTTTTLPDPFPNCAPRVTDREAAVEAGRPGRTPSALLGQYDVELDPLQVQSFTQPAHGQATLHADGTFGYTPAAGYVGADAFSFTLTDGRGGQGTATMRVRVVKPSGQWATTSFTDLTELQAGGQPIGGGNATTVPRLLDWNGDGRLDLLVGAEGGVWLYPNVGTTTAPAFGAAQRLRAGQAPLSSGKDRMALSLADMDHDGQVDLVVTNATDRTPRWLRRSGGQLAAPVALQATGGAALVVDDIRCEVADWNGDGQPDLITGSRSGDVKVRYRQPDGTFAAPVIEIDSEGRSMGGSYNLNVRVMDVNLDGIPDLVDSYNWGNINFRINTGTAAKPALPGTGTFAVAGAKGAPVDLHNLTDGPIVDLGDLNGDGAADLVMGGEVGGRVRVAWGRSAASYVRDTVLLIGAHPLDLGTYLADRANEADKGRLQTLMGALYDYVVSFATPSQREQLRDELAKLIAAFPQYLRRQKLDVKAQPGIPSLAAQVWLTMLMTGPDDPAVRKQLAQVAGFDGAYAKLLEDVGVIYIENNENPRGAEAIWQWLRTIPREVYPGTGITAADWLGGKVYLVRGHLKNTFNGAPVDGGEYAFGPDAKAVIGDRGSENWFMTVVKHEVCHDCDAYVRTRPDLNRRWGQMLVQAAGPHFRAGRSGWLSWDATREHFKEAGLWDGDAAHWDAALKAWWESPAGKAQRDFGFMRGGIDWFLGAPQESLATQGNQHWNSTEGRLQVAIDRFRRGFRGNVDQVLLMLDLWSVGLDKVRFCENDNANNQVFRYAQVHRTPQGCIDRIDLGGGRVYEFAVDAQGLTTGIVKAPQP
ncbi:MAG: VCBS repeat-containing protein [Armatimonadetes bacterium]|nr:VCBS repeat-containing protein [Armatimonadota bacterium]